MDPVEVAEKTVEAIESVDAVANEVTFSIKGAMDYLNNLLSTEITVDLSNPRTVGVIMTVVLSMVLVKRHKGSLFGYFGKLIHAIRNNKQIFVSTSILAMLFSSVLQAMGTPQAEYNIFSVLYNWSDWPALGIFGSYAAVAVKVMKPASKLFV